MEIYIKLFEVVFPVFFVVGIGYYLGKKNPKIDTKFITNFAANIGTPAMVIYAVTSTGINFEIFRDYFWYYLLAIICFSIVGIINLFLINTKDIIRELPPLIFPNTGNMGLPICLFAYGSQGLGVSVDQGFDNVKIDEDEFYMPFFDVCMEAENTSASSTLKLRGCNKNEKQKFKFNNNAEIVLNDNTNLCLTVSENSREGGGGTPTHLIRDLTLDNCSTDISSRQKWGLRKAQ